MAFLQVLGEAPEDECGDGEVGSHTADVAPFFSGGSAVSLWLQLTAESSDLLL